MKMKYNKWLVMLLCVSFAFTGCEKEAFVDETIENGNGQGAANETEVPEGYFVANLMPTTCDFSRALVNESTAVQSLRFLLFKSKLMMTDKRNTYIINRIMQTNHSELYSEQQIKVVDWLIRIIIGHLPVMKIG